MNKEIARYTDIFEDLTTQDNEGLPLYRFGTDHPLEIPRLLSYMPIRTGLGALNTATNFLYGISLDQVNRRHEAIQELTEKPELLGPIQETLSDFAEYESNLIKFISPDYKHSGNVPSRFYYRNARNGLRCLSKLSSEVNCDAVESPLLKDTLGAIWNFNESDDAKYTKGKVYRTPAGFKPYDTKWRWTPFKVGYRGYPLTGRLLPLPFAMIAGIDLYTKAKYGTSPTGEISEEESSFRDLILMPSLIVGMSPIFGTMINLQHDGMHDPLFIMPVKKRFTNNPIIRECLRSIGKVDTLQAFTEFGKQMRKNGHDTSYPTIDTTTESHYFKGINVKNPILALTKDESGVIPNDIDLSGLTTLTGPNSGGKSTIVKAILQNQLLAQAGAPVAAKELTVGQADGVYYMVPSAPKLDEEMGRFGHEMAELKEIFENSTPNTLTGLDDCMDGTTHTERLAVLGVTMRGFNRIGGNTIFSTHATELVQDLSDSGIGAQVQVEFNGESPTYRVKPGISHTSHADRVAKIVGMDEASIDESLRLRGY